MTEIKGIDRTAIRARVGAATAGPWFIDPPLDSLSPGGRTFVGNRADGREHGLWEIVHMTEDMDGLRPDAAKQYLCDAEFIAHARTDVPALLSALERVEALHAPFEIYQYNDVFGVEDFALDDNGEKILLARLCTACSDEESLDAANDREWTADWHNDVTWPCPTIVALRGDEG